MRKLIVPQKYNNKKLNTFILASFPELSINMLNKALRQKDIKINGVRIKENVSIYENDEIAVFIADEYLFSKPSIEKVFEDENILVINKTNGIEVVSDDASKSLTTILQEEYEFIKPCHRLDRNTTGLVLFAKTEKSLNILLEYAFRYLNLHSIRLTLLDVNERAHKCYLKCGFKDTGCDRDEIFLNGKYHNKLHMDILESEFNGDFIRNKNI